MAAASTSCKGWYFSAARIFKPSCPALRSFLQLGEVRYFYSHKKEDDDLQFTISSEADGYTSRENLTSHDEPRTRAIDVGAPIYTYNSK
jgi:hypothetical protein